MTETLRFKDADSIFQGRVRGNQLMLSSINLTADEALVLWDSPRLNAITWLDFDDNRLGDEGVACLARCERLTQVQYLNLNGNGVTDQGLKSLGASPYLTRLKRLHLKNNPIQGDGLMALFDSETLESLATVQVNEGWTCKRLEGWRYKSRD
ncbi:MAG: hypothetical protein COV67_10390 [Nitrospinae bacterium CG11_big_fil_rev_8_21_14_0_20_56_8]|nr:MAG: hypothetical protein COV67_10390 [Nitrospinae bacterium CG11_big_fil_rev_8_21_14_0_20_56_8]